MDAITYVEHHLTAGTAIGWLITVVSALGPNGKDSAICWVRHTIERLLPSTYDDGWMHERMLRELQSIANFDITRPSSTELEDRSEDLHQVPHEGAQPPVHNLLIAYANRRFRDDNQFVVNLEASLRLILHAVGNDNENRKIVIDELLNIASLSSTDLDSYQLQFDG